MNPCARRFHLEHRSQVRSVSKGLTSVASEGELLGRRKITKGIILWVDIFCLKHGTILFFFSSVTVFNS